MASAPSLAFRAGGKLLVLRLFRLGHVPPGTYSTQILAENGVPLVVVEFGNLVEPAREVPGLVPKLRLATPWARFLPRALRPLAIWWATLARLVLKCLREGRPKLVVAHGLQEQAIAVVLRRLLGVRYAVHVHEVYERAELSGLNRLFFRVEGPALRGAEFLVFPEKDRAAIYQARYRLACPVHVVFNCPRLRTRKPSREARAKWNLPEGAVAMAYIGGIGEENGIEEAIGALPQLPRVHFFLFGWAEGAHLRRLEELARKLGVRDRVRFPEGLVPDKWEPLDNCDLAYCVYRPAALRMRHQATASNKLTEAFAAGLPVVTTSHPDFAAVVGGYDVGLCVPALSASAVATTIAALLADEIGFRRRSRNALELHRSLFHYEKQFEGALRRFLTYFPSARPVATRVIS